MLPSELLASPEAWTQYANAVNAQGVCVPSKSLDACAWCISGAVRRLSLDTDDGCDMLYMIHAKLPDDAWGDIPAGEAIRQWNDMPDRTHAEVLALLKSCNL